jgi:hypothetical protein
MTLQQIPERPFATNRAVPRQYPPHIAHHASKARAQVETRQEPLCERRPFLCGCEMEGR